MARLIGSLNEGSLLRRTALYVGTFVLGSLAFVALMSVVLVSIAKAILPSHAATEDDKDKDKTEEAEASEAPAAGKAGATKPPIRQPKRPARTTPAADPDKGGDGE